MLLSLLLFFNYFKRRLKLARRFHRKLPVKCNFQRTFTTYSLKELEHVRKKHSKVSADNKKKSDHISHFFFTKYGGAILRTFTGRNMLLPGE